MSTKVLLDTNIIIHRETNRADVIHSDIGKLFYWLDKLRIEKIIHPITIKEINKINDEDIKKSFNIKLQSYNVLKTNYTLEGEVLQKTKNVDTTENDKNDTLLLNEVFKGTVDILITEDKKLHEKAKLLGIEDRVYSIEEYLEKVITENPDLIDYKVLSVRKSYFGEVNLKDAFFDSFREDYPKFDNWFKRKSSEPVYVSYTGERLNAFLYLKVEGKDENYSDMEPIFEPKKRLKIGSFKVELNGYRLGERFLKIIFDNALAQKVDEIYVTIFSKRDEQRRLIDLLKKWGFNEYGTKKSTKEMVLVRDFRKNYNYDDPKKTYPYITTRNTRIFIVPIYPKFHTELFPDSILRTESPDNFRENKPHRNAISKVYISRSLERNVSQNDILLFYRTGELGKSAYYTAVISAIGVVEDKIDKIIDEHDFILKCRKRSVFDDNELIKFWDYRPTGLVNYKIELKPFIIQFLHVYSFREGERLNRKKLLELVC
jgi:predicted nucleic acid-binding protein